MSRTVLLTGFEPFAGDTVNPSGLAVLAVAESWSRPETLIVGELPVTFSTASDRLMDLIDEHEPDIVIATGLAGGRSAVTPERVAINLRDARIPDNAGKRPVDEPVIAGGPDAYFSGLPVKAITHAVRAAGVPAELSQSAGTFVCNEVFYTLMHAAAEGAVARAGFIHVPWSTEATTDPRLQSLPLASLSRALTVAVRTALDVAADRPFPGGTLS
jgi:pyroglutamyl-peptidase